MNYLQMFILNNIIMMVGSLFSSYYLFNTCRNISFRNKKALLFFAVDVVFTIVLALFKDDQNVYIKILYILIICFSLVLSSEKININLLPASIISLAISFCCEYVGVFISCSILYIVGMPVKNIITTSLATIIQIIIVLLVCFIPLFVKGLRALTNEKNFGFGLLLSSYVLIFSVFLTANIDYLGNELGIIALFGVPLVISGLIL